LAFTWFGVFPVTVLLELEGNLVVSQIGSRGRCGGLMGRHSGARPVARVAVVAGACLLLAQCGNAPSSVDPKYGVAASARLVHPGEPVPKGGGYYRLGRPYTIAGQTYTPEDNPQYSAEGIASWYGAGFHGRQTANSEIYDMNSISAAHPTLPIPSYARVTNLRNGHSLIVRVNDRGPYHRGRVIDVSARAAQLLGFQHAGTARVRVEYVGRAALEGSDDRKLVATLRRGTPAPGPDEVRIVSASRSFVPQFSDAPLAMREQVPTPLERPFDLGYDGQPTRTASRVPAEASAAARRPPRSEPPSSTFEGRFAPVRTMQTLGNSPASAYAPTLAGAGKAVITGRGLY
jgi:rare lipoprotein A